METTMLTARSLSSIEFMFVWVSSLSSLSVSANSWANKLRALRTEKNGRKMGFWQIVSNDISNLLDIQYFSPRKIRSRFKR